MRIVGRQAVEEREPAAAFRSVLRSAAAALAFRLARLLAAVGLTTTQGALIGRFQRRGDRPGAPGRARESRTWLGGVGEGLISRATVFPRVCWMGFSHPAVLGRRL